MKRCQIWQSDEVKCQENCVLQTVLIYIYHSPVACKQTFIFAVYVLMKYYDWLCKGRECLLCFCKFDWLHNVSAYSTLIQNIKFYRDSSMLFLLPRIQWVCCWICWSRKLNIIYVCIVVDLVLRLSQTRLKFRIYLNYLLSTYDIMQNLSNI